MTLLEHANIDVQDVDAIKEFLCTAFEDFELRSEGHNMRGERWLHVGNSRNYIALNQASKPAFEDWRPYSGHPGVNHLGFEVNDVKTLRERLLKAGYKESTVENDHPHRTRIYFNDHEGNDWEFVEYHSKLDAERNDYKL